MMSKMIDVPRDRERTPSSVVLPFSSNGLAVLTPSTPTLHPRMDIAQTTEMREPSGASRRADLSHRGSTGETIARRCRNMITGIC